MFSKTKKLLLLGCFLLLFSITTVSAKTYTSEELSNLYKENSADYELLDLNRAYMSLEVQSLERDMKDAKKEMDTKEKEYKKKQEDEEVRDAYYKAVYNYEERVIAYEKKVNKKALASEITKGQQEIKSYDFEVLLWQYYLLVEQEKLLDETLVYYEELVSVAEKSKEVGMGTALEVEDARTQKNAIVYKQNMLSNSRGLLLKQIKNAVGIEGNDLISIQYPSLEELKPVELNVENLMKAYLANNSERQLLVEEEKVMKDSQQRGDMIYKDSVHYARQGQWKADLASLQVQQNLIDSRNVVIEVYTDYEQKADAYGIAKDMVSLDQDLLDQANRGFLQGQISELELKGAKLNHKKLQLEYKVANVYYQLTVRKIQLLYKGLKV